MSQTQGRARLTPTKRGSRYYYSILLHPVTRVLKFDRFCHWLSRVPSGGTVLDYGAGDQPYRMLLESHFERYLSADYAPSNMEYACRPDIELSSDPLPVSSNIRFRQKEV